MKDQTAGRITRQMISLVSDDNMVMGAMTKMMPMMMLMTTTMTKQCCGR
jgi:hypothetical protein